MKSHRVNKAWMQRHVNDAFVRRARQDGYRARAAYKLLEMDDQDRLIKPGMKVVELGCAPGSWSQVILQRLKGHGRVIGIDLLPIQPLAGLEFLQGDFGSDDLLMELSLILSNQRVDLVVSDMAPNLSGIRDTDQAGMLHLVELALEFARTWLKPEGAFLVKVFMGSGFDDLLRDLRLCFERVVIRKPSASRDASSEVYLLGLRCKASIEQTTNS